jgi:hypothetical protein
MLKIRPSGVDLVELLHIGPVWSSFFSPETKFCLCVMTVSPYESIGFIVYSIRPLPENIRRGGAAISDRCRFAKAYLFSDIAVVSIVHSLERNGRATRLPVNEA